MKIEDVMALAPVIPVLVIEDVADARPIAEALVAGGLRALEVTLRTEAALGVIAEMAKVKGAVVGAGTVLNVAQLDEAMAAGAQFIVSPGLTAPLGEAAIHRKIPIFPASPMPATSCTGSIWDWNASNSFRPKRPAGSRR
jgi:2-dehydro-3-deoxyphosphogluconate aldolase/(4S)-4-hydroxy-2-oxoglutarate aldolase